MKKIGSLFALLMLASGLVAADDSQMTFKVKGSNPGGGGEYTGEVALTKLGPKTASVRWTTGAKKEVTDGFAIRTDQVIGTAYGGDDVFALAVYEIKGKTIEATWSLATAPKESATYQLQGSAFKGTLPIKSGGGTVTFTAGKDGFYKVAWDLATGHFDGVGVRLGNVLVAASGNTSGVFGVAGYAPKGDDIEGLWATSNGNAPGTETWSLAEGAAPSKAGATQEVGDGSTLTFGGDTYVLKDNKSAPGQPTSELREYLRDGETWDDYRKMVAFRLQHPGDADAEGLVKATVAQIKKEHPNSYVKEIELTPESSSVLFILVVNNDVEFNLWNYRKTPQGIASAQFVFRNKPPYETQKKFKTEQDDNYDTWLAEIQELGSNALSFIKASATKGKAAAKEKGKDEEISPELVAAIKVDIDKCAAIAQKFTVHLSEDKIDEAVALVSDRAFKKMTRETFTASLKETVKSFGKLTKITPDKDATNFGMKNGLMTFTLEADAEYENSKARETLRFIRNDKGEIELIDYLRDPKR